MILLGRQSSISKDQQVKALHVYVDNLDVLMAKLLLMDLYASKTKENHEFLLGICM